MAGCRYRREAASWSSSLDGTICARATTLASWSANLSNSDSIFKHAVALPAPQSVLGRTRRSSYLGALRRARTAGCSLPSELSRTTSETSNNWFTGSSWPSMRARAAA